MFALTCELTVFFLGLHKVRFVILHASNWVAGTVSEYLLYVDEPSRLGMQKYQREQKNEQSRGFLTHVDN
jgi:hypothetical protein